MAEVLAGPIRSLLILLKGTPSCPSWIKHCTCGGGVSAAFLCRSSLPRSPVLPAGVLPHSLETSLRDPAQLSQSDPDGAQSHRRGPGVPGEGGKDLGDSVRDASRVLFAVQNMFPRACLFLPSASARCGSLLAGGRGLAFVSCFPFPWRANLLWLIEHSAT